MPYYKFTSNDIFINTIKAYPEVKFAIYNGTASYNNRPVAPGKFARYLNGAPSGAVSLFELNTDRVSSSLTWTRGDGTTYGRTIPEGAPPTYGGGGVPDNGMIYGWVTKQGSGLQFRTTTKLNYNSAQYGTIFTSSYPLTSSITKTYYSYTTPRVVSGTFWGVGCAGLSCPGYDVTLGVQVSSNGSVARIRALKNSINYYRYLSPHFKYAATGSGDMYPTRSFDHIDLGLISIPSIFYGSSIKKGTVDLKFYNSGSLIGRAQDVGRNGELIHTEPEGSNGSGSVVGIVLYNEGMVILTGSRPLAGQTDQYIGSAADYPRWIYFGGETIQKTTGSTNSAYIMNMSGTSKIPTMTMFAGAPKGRLNHSNNPSFRVYSANGRPTNNLGDRAYVENDNIEIKNIVSSSFPDPTGSFEKTTYISKIGLYDKNRNLIAIAKPATPIRKTAERDFTFKLKLDL